MEIFGGVNRVCMNVRTSISAVYKVILLSVQCALIYLSSEPEKEFKSRTVSRIFNIFMFKIREKGEKHT